jgi:hypothetical protein
MSLDRMVEQLPARQRDRLIARVITYLRYMRERDGLGIAQESDYTAV